MNYPKTDPDSASISRINATYRDFDHRTVAYTVMIITTVISIDQWVIKTAAHTFHTCPDFLSQILSHPYRTSCVGVLMANVAENNIRLDRQGTCGKHSKRRIIQTEDFKAVLDVHVDVCKNRQKHTSDCTKSWRYCR